MLVDASLIFVDDSLILVDASLILVDASLILVDDSYTSRPRYIFDVSLTPRLY